MKTSVFDKVKTVCFSGAAAAIFIACIAHKSVSFSERENRFLAERPSVNISTIADGSFMTKFESFVTDQVPLRDACTAVRTLTEKLRGMKDENGVYLGKDGYLIGKYDETMFTADKAVKNRAYLKNFAAKYEKEYDASHFEVIIVPSGSEILKDKLPDFVNTYDQNMWINDIGKEVGSEYFINATDILMPHKSEYIYYRTDHHFTTLGAYYVYKAWREKAGEEVFPLSSYKKEEVPGFRGTYDSKVNTALAGGVKSDTIELYSLPESDSAVMTWDGDDKNVYTGIFDRSKLSVKDKYSAFFGGNHAITDIKTGIPDKGSLLVIKDSYAHSVVPFAMEDYSRIVMVDLRYFNKSLKKYIHENGFSDILVLYSAADFADDGSMAKLLR